MDKAVELPKPEKRKKTSQLINKGVGYPKERERLVAKKMDHRTFKLRKFWCYELGKLLWVIKNYIHSDDPFAVLTCLETVRRIHKTSQILES